MKITLVSDNVVRCEPAPGPLTIEAPAADTAVTSFHLLAAALGQCTYDTVRSWAEQAKIGSDDLVVEVSMTFAERPHRVSAVGVRMIWPSLPESRDSAAMRAAEICSVHQTLAKHPELRASVSRA